MVTAPADASASEGLLVDGIGKSFRDRVVVNHVSLRLRRGEVAGLLGPNGAGKTTCFYMITGLIAADYGRIVLDGEDITAQPMYQRARMGLGYLPQEASIFRGMTVAQNVMAVVELREKSPSAARATVPTLAAEGTVEGWGRDPGNPVGGWYGLKKGLRGRFGNYVPPVLEVLGRQSGETVLFSRRAGDSVVYVDVIESAHKIRYAAQAGEFFPIHCSASGKAILASMPEEDRRDLIARLRLERITPNTITSVTGGNFESLLIGTATATASVTDTTDITTVSLSASSVLEGAGANYTFTATLSAIGQTDVTVHTDEGDITKYVTVPSARP